MDADAFAGFWVSQGYKVISTGSCHWFNTDSFVFLSLPFHRIITPDRGELLKVFCKGPAMVARFATPAEESECNGGLYVCADRYYDIPSLSEKARNRTRRALRLCRIERVDFSELVHWGHDIDVQTYVRQGRDPNTISYEKWANYCETAGQTEGFEAWGAFIGSEPAAYVICALVEDCYHLLKQSSATAYLKECPNNALTFTATQQAIARSEVSYVSTGLKSVEDTDGLNRYKEGMGYTLRPFRDQVVINPILRVPLMAGGSKLIHKLHQRNPGNDFWRKAVKVIDENYREQEQ